MKHSSPTLGLFEKRIEGDDRLLELARLRFEQSGLGAEMHAGSVEELDFLLKFKPDTGGPVVVHLPRHFRLTDPQSRATVREFATRFAGRVYGWVVHDDPVMATQPEVYRAAVRELEDQLAGLKPGSYLFIEYAAGLDPQVFASFLDSIRDLQRVTACIDIGHVGIRQVRHAYGSRHPNQDVCALKSEPHRLPELMDEVQTAVETALPVVLDLTSTICRLGKPVHFHLHDGHPLSNFSPFGVSDHLSFLAEIPLPFAFRGRRAAPLMFGPAGLIRLVSQVLQAPPSPGSSAKVFPPGKDRATFTLEIHPSAGSLPLGDAASLFAHWRDRTHAEQMNHWLSVLGQNHRLLECAGT
jgi:hypothetical protein